MLQTVNLQITNMFENLKLIWFYLPCVAYHHFHCLLQRAGRQDFVKVCFDNLGGGKAAQNP